MSYCEIHGIPCDEECPRCKAGLPGLIRKRSEVITMHPDRIKFLEDRGLLEPEEEDVVLKDTDLMIGDLHAYAAVMGTDIIIRVPFQETEKAKIGLEQIKKLLQGGKK